MLGRRRVAAGVVLALGFTASAVLTVAPSGGSEVAAAPAAALAPLTPARLLDTRSGPDDTTVDGAFRGLGLRPAGSVFELTVADRGGVPADADAVFVNLTAVDPHAAGYLTAYPCGTDRPTASHVNYTAGATSPNGALVGIGDGGTICIFTLAATHLLADVTAFVPAGGTPRALTPARLLDTRDGPQHATVDHRAEGGGPLAAGTVRELTVANRGGVPADADAVFVNLTAVDPHAAGYLTAYPCGTDRPTASHVNYTAGATSPNGALVGVGDGGTICIFTLAATHLLADVTAFVPADAQPRPLQPARLLDTRGGPSNVTVDHLDEHGGAVVGGEVVRLPVAGRGGVPSGATAVFLNVTAVDPAAAGYLTVWPCGVARPKASHVNYRAGEVRPNGVLVGVGTDGQVCIFTLAGSHVVADVTAYVGPPGPPRQPPTEAPAPPPVEAGGCAVPGDAWATATPAEQGMDAAALQQAIDGAMANQALAVRVYRRGCLVAQDTNPISEADQYESWSMAKAFVSLVFGRAWTLGLISPDDTLGSLIPEADAAHGAITMRQLLEQTNGLDLNPVRDYDVAMPDRLDAALRTAVVAEPGTTWGYSQHGPALLAESVSRAVQAAGYDDVQDFADRQLFSLVGVDRADWYWRRDCPGVVSAAPAIDAVIALLPLPLDVIAGQALGLLGITGDQLLNDGVCATPLGEGDGHTQGFFGLNMHPHDFARFGELLRRGGWWNGTRLLSADYVAEAIAPTPRNGCYGWLLWVNGGTPCTGAFSPDPTAQLFPGLPTDMYAFQGFLGQRVTVFPTEQLVVVRLGTQELGSTLFADTPLTETFLDEAAFYGAVLAAIVDTPPGTPAEPLERPGHATRAGLTPDAFVGALTDPTGTLGPLLLEHLLPLPPAGPVRARLAPGAVTAVGGSVTIEVICPPPPNGSACTGTARLEPPAGTAGPDLSVAAVAYIVPAGERGDVTLQLTGPARAALPLPATATATNAPGTPAATRATREIRIDE